MRLKPVLLTSAAQAEEFVRRMVYNSQYFTFEPMPDDGYLFMVKAEFFDHAVAIAKEVISSDKAGKFDEDEYSRGYRDGDQGTWNPGGNERD